MDSVEIATQLTLALINRNELYARYNTEKEAESAERVGKAFETILLATVKAIRQSSACYRN